VRGVTPGAGIMRNRSSLHRLSRARWLLLAILCACRPGVFDELVGGGQLDSGVRAGHAGGSGLDAATSAEAGAGHGGAGGPDITGGGADGALDAGSEAGAPVGDAASGPTSDGGTLTSDGSVHECPHASDLAAVHASALELGAMTIPSVTRPVINASARVGERSLWIATAPEQVALWTGSDEPLPMLPGPVPTVPLLPAAAVPANWTAGVGSIVALNDREALIYFGSYNIFIAGETGLARIGVDEVASELIHPAGQLFASWGEQAWKPVFSVGAFVHDDGGGSHVYVFACHPNPAEPSEQSGAEREGPCRLARVALELAEDGAAYRFWSGDAWVPDVASAAIVIDHVPSTLSVAYSDHLQKFLAVHTVALGNRIALRWADRPEGPWYSLGEVETLPGGGPYASTFGALEHPNLRHRCHDVLYVTYQLGIDATDPAGMPTTHFETRLMRIELD
jgi:Domain of unknown function (DUF4185)